MEQITAPYQQDKLEFIKNPVVAEFLGLSPNTDFSETKLESSIITHIQKFVMELGKGYAFVAQELFESIATANRRNSYDSQIVTSLFSK